MNIRLWLVANGLWQKKSLLALATSSMVLIAICGCQSQLYKDSRVMMGTFIEVASPYQEAGKIVFVEFQRIDNLLSKFKPESEISKLNARGKLRLSAETFSLIKKAKEFWLATDGAFDITVGPLVDLWGFTDKKYRLPTDAEIKEALIRVGFEKIILQEEENVVKFTLPEMKIDLGGIAKGYALDCAAKKLKDASINSCLINAGGQVYALGTKFGSAWRVAIKDPRQKNIREILTLKDASVSTSGDYEQYFIDNNKRYSHIIDPKSGFPAQRGVDSATVVASSGLTADVLSTAIFVLGREKGMEVARKFKPLEVRIIEENDVPYN